MTDQEDLLSRVLAPIVTAIISYIAGRHSAHHKTRQELATKVAEDAINLIRKVVDAATEYYTVDGLPARDRIGYQTGIVADIKRLSTDLSQLAQHAKQERTAYLAAFDGFNDAVTADPFGQDEIAAISPNDERILKIHRCEKTLTQVIRQLEKL